MLSLPSTPLIYTGSPWAGGRNGGTPQCRTEYPPLGDSWGSEPETISALGPGAGEGGGHCGGPGLLPGLGAAQIEEAMNSNKP